MCERKQRGTEWGSTRAAAAVLCVTVKEKGRMSSKIENDNERSDGTLC